MEFPTLLSLQNYKNTVNNFQQGEVVYLTDENKYVMYDGTDFVDMPDKVQVNNGQGLNMSLYDFNKMMVAQLPVKTTFNDECTLINEFCASIGNTSYMLLCKDISYYTVFEYSDNAAEYCYLGMAVIDCLTNVGQLICAEPTEDNNAIEIWVRTEDTDLCMYLFPCSDLIVTYGG
jgi:hypothetical protein